jgi:hypothetical protein
MSTGKAWRRAAIVAALAAAIATLGAGASARTYTPWTCYFTFHNAQGTLGGAESVVGQTERAAQIKVPKLCTSKGYVHCVITTCKRT